MYFTRLWWCLLCFFLIHTISAQDNFRSFWQPQVALNYNVKGSYSHNFSIRKRSFLYKNDNLEFAIRQFDLTHFSKWDIKDNQSISLGLTYRSRENFDGGANELRLVQQFNVNRKQHVIRYGHRFRSEQRITKALTIHRFRYRLSLDFPLQGQKLDIGEPYFVGNWETLLSVTKTRSSQYDQRFTLNFGWLLSQKTKLQLGAEYRLEGVTQRTQNVLLFLTNLNFSL